VTYAATVRAEMRKFIEESFLYLHPGVELTDGADFIESGIIDSLGFVELVEEVQSRYDVAVEDIEITEENFGSIDAIAAFVQRKRAVG
jgi:acyl carrier protein